MRRGPLETVFLDLDGTLVDTENLFDESWRRAASTFDMTVDGSLLKATKGLQLDAREFVAAVFGPLPEALTLSLISNSSIHRQQGRSRLSLLPGALQLIRKARTAGLKLCIVTNAPSWRVDETLAGVRAGEGIDLALEVDDIVNPSENARPKPAPDLYQAAALRMSCPISKAVAFEDSIEGINAAQSAGVTCIHIGQTQLVHSTPTAGCFSSFPSFLVRSDEFL